MSLAELPDKDLHIGLMLLGANGALGEIISTSKHKDGIDVEIRWESGRTIHIWKHQGINIEVL